jgi:hypothetical protein
LEDRCAPVWLDRDRGICHESFQIEAYDHAEDRPGLCPHCHATVVIPGSPNHGLADGDDIRPERLANRCPQMRQIDLAGGFERVL